jgi:hypothetical protein
MEKEEFQSLLIDYIDGKLNESDRQRVEQELVSNPERYKVYEDYKEVMNVMDRTRSLEPSGELKMSFEHAIQQELKQSRPAKTVFFTPLFYRVAAGIAFLIVAGTIGYLVRQHQIREAELATLREEMQQTRTLVMDKLNNDLSASQRIQGVNVAMEMKTVDDQIVNALVKTMNEDQNTNVRLTALEALSKFKNEPKVRQALIDAVSTQTDPVIQIALIQLMVEMKEKSIVKDLHRIIDDEQTMKAVKDEAHAGIFKLS